MTTATTAKKINVTAKNRKAGMVYKKSYRNEGEKLTEAALATRAKQLHGDLAPDHDAIGTRIANYVTEAQECFYPSASAFYEDIMAPTMVGPKRFRELIAEAEKPQTTKVEEVAEVAPVVEPVQTPLQPEPVKVDQMEKLMELMSGIGERMSKIEANQKSPFVSLSDFGRMRVGTPLQNLQAGGIVQNGGMTVGKTDAA